MTVTDLHYILNCWGGEDILCLTWLCDGRRVGGKWGIPLLAKNGDRYRKPQPPDDPLVGYLMSDFGMKISAARLLARRTPKKAPDGRELTEEERILAVHRLYEKRGSE